MSLCERTFWRFCVFVRTSWVYYGNKIYAKNVKSIHNGLIEIGNALQYYLCVYYNRLKAVDTVDILTIVGKNDN